VEQELRDDRNDRVFATTPDRFDPGIDDVIIVPLVFIALAVKKLFRAALSLLIDILDFAFPILLQLMRFLCSPSASSATASRPFSRLSPDTCRSPAQDAKRSAPS
jgi:hypothetical protein